MRSRTHSGTRPAGVKVLAFFSGLLLGLSIILPMGPRNVFVLNQGLLGGVRRGLLAVTGACDTLLILTGAAGLSALLTGVTWLRTALLAVGALFVAYVGFGSLRAPTGSALPAAANGTLAGEPSGATDVPARSIVLTGIGVSWGNPHAIPDTVAGLGHRQPGPPPARRSPFSAPGSR